ncbi:MAG: hypothetical protein AAB975_04225 [Patescibacteria group bacterium]
MRHETECVVAVGAKIKLHVVEFNGNPILETKFIQYDAELRKRDLRECGIGELDFIKCEAFDDEYIDGQRDFRSVRFFHLAGSEKIQLKIGDEVQGTISTIRLAKEKTKDKRRKLHITVSNVVHIYRWMRRRVSAPHCLIIACFCGNRLIKEKEIPLILKNAIEAKDGQAHPIAVELLPNGSVLGASLDYRRHMITTGDYRLAERLKGRTMRDIDKDFLRVPSFDRIIPTRERRYLRHTHA